MRQLTIVEDERPEVLWAKDVVSSSCEGSTANEAKSPSHPDRMYASAALAKAGHMYCPHCGHEEPVTVRLDMRLVLKGRGF